MRPRNYLYPLHISKSAGNNKALCGAKYISEQAERVIGYYYSRKSNICHSRNLVTCIECLKVIRAKLLAEIQVIDRKLARTEGAADDRPRA